MDLKHQQLFPPPSKGSRYIVVLSDYLTLWVERENQGNTVLAKQQGRVQKLELFL